MVFGGHMRSEVKNKRQDVAVEQVYDSLHVYIYNLYDSKNVSVSKFKITRRDKGQAR